MPNIEENIIDIHNSVDSLEVEMPIDLLGELGLEGNVKDCDEAVRLAFAKDSVEILRYLIERGVIVDDLLEKAVDANAIKILKEMGGKIGDVEGLLDRSLRRESWSIVNYLMPKSSDPGKFIKRLLSAEPDRVAYHLGIRHLALSEIGDYALLGIANIDGAFSYYIKKLCSKMMRKTDKLIVLSIDAKILGRPEIMRKMSGFINPGMGDTFPGISDGFALEDLDKKAMMPTEHVYQEVISYAKENNIPYMGLCSGSQHLILNSGGMLKSVGYPFLGGHGVAIEFLKGTASHYMAMNSEEQRKYLESGESPQVVIEDAVVLHSYGGIVGKEGEGVVLGGVPDSDPTVAEAFSVGKDMFGFQFHPEYAYGYHNEGRNAYLVDNFFKLVMDRHETVFYARQEGHSEEVLQEGLSRAEKMFMERLKESGEGMSAHNGYLWGKEFGNVTVSPREEECGVLDIMEGVTFDDLEFVEEGADMHVRLLGTDERLVVKDQYGFGAQRGSIGQVNFADGSRYVLPESGHGEGGSFWGWDVDCVVPSLGVGDILLGQVAVHCAKKLMNWGLGCRFNTQPVLTKPIIGREWGVSPVVGSPLELPMTPLEGGSSWARLPLARLGQ